MTRTFAMVIALAALGAPACGGKKEEPKPTAGSAPAATGSADPAAAGSADPAAAGSADPATPDPVAEVDVPTEVDFEEDAATKIDEKNLEAQLKAVEEELAQ